MKILHIADLHLGKVVHNYNLIDEQKDILNQIIEQVKTYNIDALVISGDIYDRSVASSEAIETYNNFLNQLGDEGVNVLVIGGNHDGYSRLEFGKEFFKSANIFIKADYRTLYEKVTIDNVNFYLVNYFDPIFIGQIIEQKLNTQDEAMQVIVNAIKTELNTNETNILLAHGYFTKYYEAINYDEANLNISESERVLSIGNSDLVNVLMLSDFDYVALGHLHQRQKVSENAYYSGSIYPYSFSEVNSKKGSYFYNTETKEVKFITFNLKRTLKIITGYYHDIISEYKDQKIEDYVQVILKDDDVIYNLMENLKQVFVNIMLVTKIETKQEINDLDKSEIKLKSDVELFSDFYQQIKTKEINQEEQEIIVELLEKINKEES